MKICFIAPKAYSVFNPKAKGVIGGAQVQLSLLSKEFAKHKDLDIYFMVADYGQKKMEVYEGVKVWKSLNLKDNPIKKVYSFFKMFKKINADVYIHRTLTAASGLMALYCRIFKKKFIYMVAHDSEVDGAHAIYKKIISRVFPYLTYKFSNLIIIQNHYQKKVLKKRGINNISLIKSGYLIKKNQQYNKKNILWVGRSANWKRPELLLKLAKKFPNENFVMICNSNWGGEDLFYSIKKEASNINNIKFIDYVSFEKIDTYFQKAKIFINTSDQEGFPNTFIQAAKNKTPIISLNSNPDNFLKNYECGFCCSGKFDLMTQYLKKLLADKNLYQKASDNAYDYAKQNHDIRTNSQSLLRNIIN